VGSFASHAAIAWFIVLCKYLTSLIRRPDGATCYMSMATKNNNHNIIIIIHYDNNNNNKNKDKHDIMYTNLKTLSNQK
jgi:hypothetical protein